jgi:NMT1/THI5 like
MGDRLKFLTDLRFAGLVTVVLFLGGLSSIIFDKGPNDIVAFGFKQFVQELKPPATEYVELVSEAVGLVVYLTVLCMSGFWTLLLIQTKQKNEEVSKTLSDATTAINGALSKTETAIESALKDTKSAVSGAQALMAKNTATIVKSVEAQRATHPLKIGIMGELLVYAPLYLAKGLGYFTDEGIEIEIKVMPSDEQIAMAVKQSTIDIGICDPIHCLRQPEEEPESRLEILFPLAKRFGAFAVVKKGAWEDIEGEVKRKFRIVTYGPGTTSRLTAEELKRQLFEKCGLAQVEIVEWSSNKENNAVVFAKPKDLRDALEQANADFAILWEPQLTWALKIHKSDWHVLVVKSSADAGNLSIEKMRPSNASDRWEWGVDRNPAWRPSLTDITGTEVLVERCLITAAIASGDFVTSRSVAARRFVRALSRASILLHSVKWSERTGSAELFDAFRDSMATSIPLDSIDTGDTALVPFVYKIDSGGEVYWQHLQNLENFHNLGSKNPTTAGSASYYKSIFATIPR